MFLACHVGSGRSPESVLLQMPFTTWLGPQHVAVSDVPKTRIKGLWLATFGGFHVSRFLLRPLTHCQHLPLAYVETCIVHVLYPLSYSPSIRVFLPVNRLSRSPGVGFQGHKWTLGQNRIGHRLQMPHHASALIRRMVTLVATITHSCGSTTAVGMCAVRVIQPPAMSSSRH